MTSPLRRAPRRLASVLALCVGAATVGLVVPTTASADTTPAAGTPATVTADPLPTVQVNGVVWTQVVSGNVVYAGGKFTTARPAGAAPGTSTVTRNNLLAYDVRTGALITSFTPDLNSDVRSLAVSPDGTRLYVAGQFTAANGQTRNRIAAYDTATGALVSSFRPSLDTRANAVVATNDTVYLGGVFTSVNGVQRSRLAAVRASDGALLSWAPSADLPVFAMVLADAGRKVIAGGSFSTMNGGSALGLAALDPTSGGTVAWNAGKTVQSYGVGTNPDGTATGAAFNSLSTDGTNVYGTSYNYYGKGNLEGTFAARADTGDIAWIEDCHGDTYGAYAQGDAVYTVSHAHSCETLPDGFPETTPRTNHHALAFSTAAVNKILPNRSGGYGDFTGQPAPAMLRWFPDLAIGSFTGQNQSGWTITGNGSYVVAGGEFPSVNGVAQQGLVRFAKTPVAPGKSGPVATATKMAPTLFSPRAGTVRVSFLANWDRDNENLTYNILRDGVTAPVFTTTAKSTFWQRPTLGFLDNGLAPGSRHRYRVVATDPNGNSVSSYDIYVTVSADTTGHPYADAVLQDGAGSFWRLGESGGALGYDYSGFSDLTLSGGVTRGTAGAIADDSDAATSFDGKVTTTGTGTSAVTTYTTGYTPSPIDAPNTFTIEAWVKTTSTSGGKIVGFGNTQTGNSSNYDRHIYMDSSGRLVFGVYRGGPQVLTTPGAYNDGSWHQVVGQMSPAGTAFYVDGVRIGRNAGVTSSDPTFGYWRVGGDNLGGWPGSASGYLAGSIDDVAVYPTALSATQVRNHFTLSGRTAPGTSRPSDAYGQTVYDSSPDSYWRLDEASGTTAADSSSNSAVGTYVTGVTQGAAGALANGQGKAATFNGSTGLVVGTQQVSNPRTYTEELWFNTTTTRGGKLIGFGSATTGNSSNYDRHVYMLDSGQLRFGVYTGQLNLIDSAKAYNDGTWHHLVATQNTTDGMKMYVDGALVGSNPQVSAEGYNGYWRVGGDNTWGGASSNYFAGTIDEVAVYSSSLSAADVVAHYKAAGGQLPNQAPTASFTASGSGLTGSFDGSASSDSDGTIASYAWDFGDGSTGTGVKATRTYAAGGTYSVKLTVTDDKGLTGTTTKSVTVTAPPAPPASSTYATDVFNRLVTGGLGTADTGGAWSLSGKATSFAVEGGAGRITAPTAGQTSAAFLGDVSSAQTDAVVDIALDKAQTGGGTYVSVVGRRVDAANDYRLKLRYTADGKVSASAVRAVAGVETTLAATTVPNVTYAAGDVLRVRLQVTGTNPSTVRARVWPAGASEPTSWAVTATDATAALQVPGGFGLLTYLSGSATNAPMTAAFDNLVVGAPAGG